MATAARVDAHGFTRCEQCGRRFKDQHSCRGRRGEYMPRRPADFQDLVDEAARERQAEEAAAAQLSFDDIKASCWSCGATDKHIDPASGQCTSCMAAAARETAARVADWRARTRQANSPP